MVLSPEEQTHLKAILAEIFKDNRFLARKAHRGDAATDRNNAPGNCRMQPANREVDKCTTLRNDWAVFSEALHGCLAKNDA